MNILRFLLFVALWAPSARAELCLDPHLENQPVLADGRVTPLFAHAARLKKHLFADSPCPDVSPTALYCYLSTGRRSEVESTHQCKLILRIDHADTKRSLGLPADSHGIAPAAAWAQRDELLDRYHQLSQAGQKSTQFATDLALLLERIDALSDLEAGTNWKIPTGNGAWTTFKDIAASPEKTLGAATEHLSQEERSSLSLETTLETVKPFAWAIVLAMAGFLLSLLSRQSRACTRLAGGVLVALLLLEASGIALRILISGRAPVTNMYETVMWSGFCAFTLASLLGFFLKDPRIWAFGFAGNALCLLMMNFASGMLDPTIQPLVPVLRDNFWLSTHVTSVTLSYACFALSWLISNYVLIRYLVNPAFFAKAGDGWNHVIRIAMQIGTVFLALGVILGGVWADYSWGRFWGWDPKETWSLIALIVYMAILHGRYAGWFTGIMFAFMGGVGFLFVLMAWFGVNYILATGLHSYGFSSGGAFFLATIFTIQIVILGLTYARIQLTAAKGHA
ncbi:MAG: cytochrome c biogenesis protein [Bdellovibrionota bacterium]